MIDNKDYNTSRNEITLPDYGRNIQKMIEFISTIENRDERNKAASTLANIMYGMNSSSRENNVDLRQRIWSQIAIISNFTLDVDYPFEVPRPEHFNDKPSKIEIPQSPIKFRHYGKIMENMIKKAVTMEDGEMKEALIKIIANHMKKLYLIWNRESVGDDLIFSDMQEIAGTNFGFIENLKLNETRDILSKNKRTKRTHRK
ncbi:MAG TPA: DUF4290 domain-containing protein [Bacteroidales bacterium]|nr:MAG: hypothetical protein A2W98_08795 [Bacteroidetes bacterium GWF2_33_38]OFY76248.1 MAG: hypothetical protein A2265_10880 [Bacteroidetes bacterium RIFOXYA12_FULL_33_9]OFY84991.1 MAG: hypothetical protein A2236_03230 [Bacteroidetes bacterium RIFOXYA2_FULL_33_7]HBF87421.1 DUF4290 domain-containing protein [Bacteroidales bacterium]